MAHVRQQIFEAIQAALSAAKVPSAHSIFVSPEGAIQAAECPAFTIDDGSEAFQYRAGLGGTGTKGRLVERRVRFLVRLFTAGNNAVSDRNAMLLDIEKALAADVTLGGTCGWFELDALDTEPDIEGAPDVWAAELGILITYKVEEQAPDVRRG